MVFSHGTARAIYMQSSSKSISAGLKTHAARVSHERSLYHSADVQPEKLTSLQTDFLFRSWAVGAPHCMLQRLTMEPEAAARVGHLSHFVWFLRAPGMSCSFYSPFVSNWACYYIYFLTFSQRVLWSQQMKVFCPRYGFCWALLRGFCGALSSPPDLTPFTLSKQHQRETQILW